jgi:hypothetical protein
MNIVPKLNKLFLIVFINLVFLNPLSAQFTLVGKVSDAKGNPIPFALVWDSIAKSGTKCNSSGFFELKKTDLNNVLRISSVGKPITRVVVKNQDSLFIVMIDDTTKKNKRDIVIKKPVIYLYPEKETEVNIKVEFEGKFNFTYPSYENGWVVNAYPSGKLINKKDNKTYSYLFWDGEKQYPVNSSIYESGFIIHRDTTVSFLQYALNKIGLNEYEANEFIVFWTPYLIKNEWNFIHFRTGKEYETISKNIAIPKPDVEFRVFLDFMKIDKPYPIKNQTFISVQRKGFTLVEWGGAEFSQPTN